MDEKTVYVCSCNEYDSDKIFNLLPNEVFNEIRPGNKVVIKPNWIRENHISKPNEWEQIITHPTVVTAVFQKVLHKLEGKGRISIVDGPETASDFEKIIAKYPVARWEKMVEKTEVQLEIIDLRDNEWEDNGNVVLKRKDLPGDPRGSTHVNLKHESSEFFGHKPTNGYYGADSNINETNKAHNGEDNLYRVSKTVIESDVFVNVPKLKTHKKAGITANLKNLVGINTYKNYLPHNSIGTVCSGGDQFPESTSKSKVESRIMPILHQYFLSKPFFAFLLSPFISLGRKIFGSNEEVIRGGSWYGNNTIWRMIIDLNKVLFYAKPEGGLKKNTLSERKKYITIVDAIVAGEGNGPKSPDAILLGKILAGNCPATVDAVCALIMGFDYQKIPAIYNSFAIKNYSYFNGNIEETKVILDGEQYTIEEVKNIEPSPVKPHKGWIGHIEL